MSRRGEVLSNGFWGRRVTAKDSEPLITTTRPSNVEKVAKSGQEQKNILPPSQQTSLGVVGDNTSQRKLQQAHVEGLRGVKMLTDESDPH